MFLRAAIAVLSITLLALATACGASPLDPSRITTITVSPGLASVPLGGVARFTAIAIDLDGDPVAIPVTWTSSNPAVAIVDAHGRTNRVAPGTTVIRATAANGVFGEATLTVTAIGFCSPPPAGSGGLGSSGIVYRQGFEGGPVNPDDNPELRITEHPDIVIEWQDVVARTGNGAYRLIGGVLTEGDANIHNLEHRIPFGGLEVWAGGAFCFVSFPDSDVSGAVWLIATVPTDGIEGADNKPVAAVNSSGKLELLSSNSAISSELDFPLLTRTWYYIVVHGVNGVDQTQELYLYDGTSDALLGRTSIVLDVTGTFGDRITKWGFGTSQDSSGLDYFLDDIYHASGSANPGPIRVP